MTDYERGLYDGVKEYAQLVRRSRNIALNDVLEIIDSHKYGLCWSISEKLWNEKLDKIKKEVLEMKGGEHE